MNINNKQKGKEILRTQLRFMLLYPLVLWSVFYIFSDTGSLKKGVLFILLELTIRSWANSYVTKKNELSATASHKQIRYLLLSGSCLVLLGALIALNASLILTILLLLTFIVGYYYQTIYNQSRILLKKIIPICKTGKKNIWHFLSSFFLHKEKKNWQDQIKRYLTSQEHMLITWTLIAIILFHLKEEILVEHENIDLKLILLIVSALVLVGIDIAGEWFQKRMRLS